jgi:colanic acid biosynthesis glycosyl transferase WcaI
MRILFIGLNYAPEFIGIGPYSAGLAQSLAAAGHEVTAIVGRPYYPAWQPFPGSSAGWARATEKGVRIVRCPHYIPAAPSGAKRLLHHASFAASALVPALRAALGGSPDIVFTVAPSLMSVPVAWLAAKLGGAKLWLHVQDFEVEAAFATGLMDSGGGMAGTARSIENRLLSLADRVSTISPQMMAKLGEKGVLPAQRYELRNWADDSIVFPAALGENPYRQEWDLGARKVALYSGNIANKQGIEIVIEAARLLRERSDLVFVICGQGPNRARLEQLAEGLTNVQIHDLQPAARMGELLALAAVHLLPQIPGAADLVLPSKLTNMLRSGRPVVATAAPGTGLYAEVEGCGALTVPGDAAGFAEAIAALIDDPARRDELGHGAAARASERWSRSAILGRFEQEAHTLVESVRGKA